jgi:hypothetical protein
MNQGARTMFSTSFLDPVANVSVAPAKREAGRRLDAQGVRNYLQGVFSATPAVPAHPNVGGPMQDLLYIATSYTTTNYYPDPSGIQLQLTDTIYDVRSFTNFADYYYVDQSLIATQGTNPFQYVITYNDVPVSGTTLISSPDILQPSPQSNPPATTYTSGVSESFGGSFGFNEAQGFNASVNASLTISNSTTVTVPPIQIWNMADPDSGDAAWEYGFSTPPNAGISTTLIAPPPGPPAAGARREPPSGAGPG